MARSSNDLSRLNKDKAHESSLPETTSPLRRRFEGTPASRQQTISQILHSSDRKRTSPVVQASSPTHKRRKFGQSLAQTSPSPANPAESTKPASTATMYNFSSSQTDGSQIVDLTGSSLTSPNRKLRRISVTSRVDVSSANRGVKTLPVKNLRTSPRSDSSQYCNKTFEQLNEALTAIFAGRGPLLSNEELYRGAENLCKLGKEAELNKRLVERMILHVVDDVKASLLPKAGMISVDVLKAVLEAWSVWNKKLLMIRSIFFYLDRSYLLRQRLPSIYDASISQFRSVVFEGSLKSEIIEGASELLLADRKGASRDQGLFREAVKMFHELHVYTPDFEPYMLAESQHYIAVWADKECSERELPSYVAACVEFIDAETSRCEGFDLDTTTRRELLTLLEHHLIERKEAGLTNQDSVADLLDENDTKATASLEQLYSLLQRRRLGTKVRPAFTKWIEDTGTAIIFDEKEQDKMVVRLLALKLKLDNIWRFSFHKNEELGRGLRESFETFINKSKKSGATWGTDNSKPGEMIAKYVDMLLKTGAKAIPVSLTSATTRPAEAEDEGEDEDCVDEDMEVNNQLDQVLDLFRFVHGKAVFEAFYKKDLARRLLMGRSASADAERNMLARLKTECGAGFTQNLEQMFKDVEMAREEMNAYKTRFSQDSLSSKPFGIDLNVNILSSAAWPSYPDVPVAIPPEIKKTIDNFETHYYQKHSGRKLQWKHALAHCQLKASFAKGDRELVVSSFQAIVLLLFNRVGEGEKLTYDFIKSESGLTDPELIRTLQSLSCAKLRPLTKTPKSRDIAPTDVFHVSSTFTTPKYRVKINSIQLKETKEENKETHVRVAADRQFETQAAIVRIMKGRKRIGHAELVSEVISATKSRGVMAVADIKRNIDKLIEKEYLERGEGNTYDYLA